MDEPLISIEDEIRSYLEFAKASFCWGEQVAVSAGFSRASGELHGLERIRNGIGDCRRCKLHKNRRNIVFGAGPPASRLVFVGEAPGEEEDIQGEPFVGKAGALLNDIIRAMGLKREDVYICNVVKCRPPDNRTPEEDEIASCAPFLFAQLETISPEIIVALGAVSAQALLATRESIFKLRGRFYSYNGMKLMPTFHPGFLLRNPSRKRDVWNDIKIVMKEMGLKIKRQEVIK